MHTANLWIPGFMPLQFLLLFAVVFLVAIGLQRMLARLGWRITTLWQVLLLWTISYACLKFLVFPPLPSHLMANYLGVIAVALFLYATATDGGAKECLETVGGILGGRGLGYRLLRASLFVAVPTLTYAMVHDQLLPPIPDTPIEFRTYHPAPPASIVVHGEHISLQTAKNPFRVGEGLKPPVSRE